MVKKSFMLVIALVFVVAQIGLVSAASTGTTDTGPGLWSRKARVPELSARKNQRHPNHDGDHQRSFR